MKKVIMGTVGEFVEDRTETHLSVGNHSCYVNAISISSGKQKEITIQTFNVDNRDIPEALD